MQGIVETTKYVKWLISTLETDSCPYLPLCLCLNSLEFYWIKSDDRNRAADAKQLREDYISEFGDDILDSLPVSSTVLEVLVALSHRANGIINESPYTWFVLFLKNLGLDFLTNDNWSDEGHSFVISVVHKWLDRRFSPNGSGSPFRSAKYDITTTSMWDSLQWYLADTFGEGHI